MEEVWKPIMGYENYEVSNLGNVRRKYINTTKNLKTMLNEYGYCCIELWKDRKRKRCKIHRLVAIMFLNNPKHCKEVNHLDGNKNNNCVSNLEWCNRSENIKHAYQANLTKGRRLLNSEEIEFIRNNYKCRDRQHSAPKLATMFGVKPSVVYDIINRRTCKKVV